MPLGIFLVSRKGNNKNCPDVPSAGNGLDQRVAVAVSTGLKCG